MAISKNCIRGLAKKFNLDVVSIRKAKSIRAFQEVQLQQEQAKEDSLKPLIEKIKDDAIEQEYYNAILKTLLYFMKNNREASFREFETALSKALPPSEIVQPMFDRHKKRAEDLFLAMPDEMKLGYLQYVESRTN